MIGKTRRLSLLFLAVSLSTLAPRQGLAAPLGGKRPKGFEEALGIEGDRQAKDFEVWQVDGGAPGNVFWPGDAVSFNLRFLNLTDQPIRAKGKVEAMQCGTRTSGTVFNLEFFQIADLGAAPVEVDLPANGSCDVRVDPKIPEKFGGYVLVAELEGRGRCRSLLAHRRPRRAARSRLLPLRHAGLR
ncbi:MAG: hypothetical protein NTW86_16765 [Candidatus Sumerlaeota bacterium]|nr:hypothetical protein [Candidatus Sumerlaeota bacterium]